MKSLISIAFVAALAISFSTTAYAVDDKNDRLPKTDSKEYKEMIAEFKSDAYQSCMEEAPDVHPEYDMQIYCSCAVTALTSKMDGRVRTGKIKTFGEWRAVLIELYSQIERGKGEFWDMILFCQNKSKVKKT